MGKRSNQAAAKATAKKLKVDPALAVVMDSVKKATHLPDQCSAMLASMLPFSLAVTSDERAECQQRVVGMVEETLGALKSEMEASVRAEEAKLDGLKTTMAELLGTVKEAEATLAAKKETLQAAKASLDEATTIMNASFQTLDDQRSAHSKCETELSSVQEEKSALEKAFQDHFQVPMEAGEGPHFKDLEPFLKNMDIEKSMRSTLPGTCAKAKDDRGSFDQVILEQLEKTIAAKIASLGDVVTAQTASMAEGESAVVVAEADYNAKKEIHSQSTVACEAAQTEVADGEAALKTATEAVNAFQPQLEEATEVSESTKAKLSGFESGPLAHFHSYKTKTAVEVAPAGA
jgi:chromosome segregation ATPase